jgi:hypothetical protein
MGKQKQVTKGGPEGNLVAEEFGGEFFLFFSPCIILLSTSLIEFEISVLRSSQHHSTSIISLYVNNYHHDDRLD